MSVFTTADGCRLNYELRGSTAEGPPAVFLNGLAQTALVWMGVWRRLVGRLPVLCYDGRGQGASAPGRQEPDLDLHVDDLAALLSHLGIGRVRLVGLSHGAHVALRFAATHPGKTQGAVLCSLGDRRSLRARLIIRNWHRVLVSQGLEEMGFATLPAVFSESFLQDKRGVLEAMVHAMVRHNRAESLATQLAAMPDYPEPVSYAGRVRCPVLVVSGGDDPLVPPARAAALAAACRGRHLLWNGVGHSVCAEAPQRLAAALADFFGCRSS